MLFMNAPLYIINAPSYIVISFVGRDFLGILPQLPAGGFHPASFPASHGSFYTQKDITATV